MTENEAKTLLCQMYLPQFDEEEKQALTMAIQALEKQSMVNEILHELREYSAIGTVEEFKDLKEKSVAKKPMIEKGCIYRCPNCYDLLSNISRKHKCNCGQNLNWE